MLRNEEERIRGSSKAASGDCDLFVSVLYVGSVLSQDCWSGCRCVFFWLISFSRLEMLRLVRGCKSAMSGMSVFVIV